MARYTLKDDGYPFRKIMTGRKWIGRVYKNAEGSYTGKIGKTEATGNSFVLAFENVVTKNLGYDSVDDLEANNAQVRAARSAAKARAQYAFDEMLKNNFEPLDKLLGFKKGD